MPGPPLERSKTAAFQRRTSFGSCGISFVFCFVFVVVVVVVVAVVVAVVPGFTEFFFLLQRSSDSMEFRSCYRVLPSFLLFLSFSFSLRFTGFLPSFS